MRAAQLKQEIAGKISEGLDQQKALARRGDGEILVLEDPGVGVWDEGCVEACREGWVDVGLGAVADHPGCCGDACVALTEIAVGGRRLFGEDLDGAEERREV